MYFFIIPKGIKAFPFILFFMGIVMAFACVMDTSEINKDFGSVVNVAEANYDELPDDARYFVFNYMKVVDAKSDHFPGYIYNCLGEFKDGESNTHYVRFTMAPADEDYDKFINHVDYRGDFSGDVYLSGTYMAYGPQSEYSDERTRYNPDQIDNEKTRLTMYCVSRDPDYGNAQNALIQQKKQKTIIIGVVSAIVAVLSAVAYVMLRKAGK